MSDLPSREEVAASLAVVDHASTMGVDPVVRYPTLRLVLDAYESGRLVDREAVALCWRRSCGHPIAHHSRSKGRCLHDCGCPTAQQTATFYGDSK